MTKWIFCSIESDKREQAKADLRGLEETVVCITFLLSSVFEYPVRVNSHRTSYYRNITCHCLWVGDQLLFPGGVGTEEKL